ncbi:MAG: alpha/beta hydrolase [Oligoflexia bacterium]|nr:alpha/beta hydrolase [Oligoflexia bacterium]
MVLNAPKNEFINSAPAIILVHGFYGSFLRSSSTKRRTFLTASSLLFNTINIGYQTPIKDLPRASLELEGMFGSISIVPYLFEVDVYNKLAKTLANETNYQVIPLVYDWREHSIEAVRKLDNLIEELKDKGVEKITIIAHSMGGLVVSYYLGFGVQNPQEGLMNWSGAKKVNRVVFLGTPFRGAMSILKNMELGGGYFFNSKMIPPENYQSFPSSYILLPSLAEAIEPKSMKSVPLDLHSDSFWMDHRLGLFRVNKKISEESILARKKYIKEQMANAYIFRERSVYMRSGQWSAPRELKVLNVIGHTNPTLDKAAFNTKNNRFYFSESDSFAFDTDILYRDGDGTVTVSSATVPPALEPNTKTIMTSYQHAELFSDPDVYSEIKATLME